MPINTNLRKKMFDDIAKSNLTNEDAKKLKLQPLPPEKTDELAGQLIESYQIPYFGLDGKKSKFWRIRYLDAPLGFTGKVASKYSQPAGEPPSLYFPPLVNWRDIANDCKQPLMLTEGEKKAACITKLVMPCIGLGGVYSFQTKSEAKPVVDDFLKINWKNRQAFIVYDADLKSNKQVRQALTRLAHQLAQLGADVWTGHVPEIAECGKAGVDDFIFHRGLDAFNDEVMGACEQFAESKELHSLNDEVVYVRDPSLIVRISAMQKMGVQTFYDQYANRHITTLDARNNMVKKNAAKEWMQWPLRSEVEGITYKPGQPLFVDDSINEWRGWGCIPKKGNIAPWKKLMSYVFGKDAKARHWFESWCAIQFQQPGVKLYSAVMIWSIHEGTGKSLIGHTLGKIFGDNFAEIGHEDLVEGGNSWGVNKQFVLGDEVTSNEQRSIADRLKRMITRSRIIIKIKYVPEYYVEDTLNYFLTSNHPNGVFMDDQDRRYFIWEIAGAPLPEKFYLEEYDTWLQGDGPSHLFQYFLDYDIGDFTAKTRALYTSAKQEMILQSKSDVAYWVHALATTPDNVLKVGGVPVNRDLFTSAQLLSIYDPDKRTRHTANSLGRELKRKGICKLPAPTKFANGEQHHFYAVRNVEKWLKAPRSVVLKHVEQFEPRVSKNAKKHLE